MPLLGAVAWPLTQSVGPVHTFDILATVSIAASGASMVVLLRHWSFWWPAAFLGGLLFACSPYVVAEGLGGRLHLMINFLIPLIVLVFDKLLRDDQATVWRFGVALGVLVAAEVLISEETLFILGCSLALTLIMTYVARGLSRGRIHIRFDRLAQGTVCGLVVAMLLCAYPIFVQLGGKYRVHGPVQSAAQLALFSSDLVSPVVPGQNQWLDFHAASDLSSHFATGYAAEVTTYLGLPLIVLMLLGIFVARRRRGLFWLLSGLGCVSFVLTLGPRLIVANHQTWFPLPDAALAHLPGFENVVPSRYAAVLMFTSAAILALVISEIRSGLNSKRPARSFTGSRFGGPLALLVGAAVLIPLIPSWPYGSVPANVPTFFTSPAIRQLVPAASVALVYPIPRAQYDQAMLWQAESGMRFRQPGAYAVAPSSTGTATFYAYQTALEGCVDSVYSGGSVAANCQSQAIRNNLRRLSIKSIIIPMDQPYAATVSAYFQLLFCEVPFSTGGVHFWRIDPGQANRLGSCP